MARIERSLNIVAARAEISAARSVIGIRQLMQGVGADSGSVLDSIQDPKLRRSVELALIERQLTGRYEALNYGLDGTKMPGLGNGKTTLEDQAQTVAKGV